METAKIFENGRSQAVRLPKQFRFNGNEVFIKRVGKSVMLMPKEENALWDIFLEGLNSFSDDCFKDGRMTDIPSVREEL